MRRADLVTAGVALVVHAGLALAVVRVGQRPAPPPPQPKKPIVLEYARKPEPAPPKAAPPQVARPAVHAPRARKVAVAARVEPARHAQAAERPAPPPAPVYAVAMSSPTDASSAVAVPRGQPGGTGTSSAATGSPRAAGGGDGTGFRPASARDVGAMPEVDTDACGRAAVYPHEAERSGTEGDVRLRVALTEEGKVHDVRVLSSLGRGFDAAAVDAIKHRCKFKPAMGRDGQPVAFVIQSYTFHFELPR